MAVDMAGGRPSKTVYKVVRRFGDFTMLEVMPATGRTHQIRVHMSYIGHPLLGDDKYGTRGRLARPALHARTLGFTHPATGESLVFTSELPADLKEFISKAGR
jgi:23S rRNA pseudouridine1911/1915/1917 synthase